MSDEKRDEKRDAQRPKDRDDNADGSEVTDLGDSKAEGDVKGGVAGSVKLGDPKRY